MGLPLFQNFPLSMAEGLHKSPSFNTVRQMGPAGINAGIALKPYPTWNFQCSFENIQGNEQAAQTVVAQFFGLYMATAGGANPFIFVDPQDNTEVGAQFGVGDGVHTSYQLSRNIFGQVDIIQNLIDTPTIFVNGQVSVPASISSSGIVTFTEVPNSSDVLTWSGQFGYRCRFTEDTLDAVRTFTVNNGIDMWTFSGLKFNSEFIPGIQNFGVIAAPGGANT